MRVLVEECELAGWVMRALLPHAKSVEVSEPKHNAWIARSKRKSDPVDAAKLAELLRGGFNRAVYQPEDEEMANFKIAVQPYDQMTKATTRLKCQIKARFRQQRIMTTGKSIYGLAGRQKAISMVKSEAIAEILRQDYRLLDEAQKERVEARRLVTKLSRDFLVIKRLKRIHGVSRCNPRNNRASKWTPILITDIKGLNRMRFSIQVLCNRAFLSFSTAPHSKWLQGGAARPAGIDGSSRCKGLDFRAL